MIDDPRIEVSLNTDFFDESQPYNKKALLEAGVPVVYTGPVDRYFDYRFAGSVPASSPACSSMSALASAGV